jgi:Polyketide cyclase / dehydrase and lipid transport
MMMDREQYTPGPAYGAQVKKDAIQKDGVEKHGDQKDNAKWTLILVRELRHSPEKVWQALTDPAHLREWAPFVVDGNLGTVGNTVNLTWVGAPTLIETRVTRADAPRVLEYGDQRWELEAFGSGTRLTLWIDIDRRFISWGAAGWHIAFDVLDRLLSGTPIGRIVGSEMTKFGWQRLVSEYAKQFGAENPNSSPRAAENS